MRSGWAGLSVAVLALVALGACTSSNPQLMHLKPTTDGPDEFAILPSRPLEMPENTASLPPPTLGASNRADLQPMNDAIVALGGQAVASTGGVPGSDKALSSYAGRYGVDPGIRTTLATEDYAFRKKHPGKLLERIFNVTSYFRAYAPYSLDQQAELARWRRAGVPTPAAPPSDLETPPEIKRNTALN